MTTHSKGNLPMTSTCFLGVDLGASSGRLMSGLFDGTRISLEEIHRFPNGPVAIGDTLRWDVLRLWSEIQDGLAGAAARFGKSVASVGVDTWGVDYVLLSRAGEILGQPYHYRDARTNGVPDRAFTRVPRHEIFAETGLQFLDFNTLFQLLAMQESDRALLESADRLLMMPDSFHWCLSGIRVHDFPNVTTNPALHPPNG